MSSAKVDGITLKITAVEEDMDDNLHLGFIVSNEMITVINSSAPQEPMFPSCLEVMTHISWFWGAKALTIDSRRFIAMIYPVVADAVIWMILRWLH